MTVYGTLSAVGSILDDATNPAPPAITLGPVTITNDIPGLGSIYQSSINSGDNTIAVPPGAVAAMVTVGNFATSASGITLKVRTNLNASDSGLPIAISYVPFLYSFPAGAPTSIIINSSASSTVLLTVVFV